MSQHLASSLRRRGWWIEEQEYIWEKKVQQTIFLFSQIFQSIYALFIFLWFCKQNKVILYWLNSSHLTRYNTWKTFISKLNVIYYDYLNYQSFWDNSIIWLPVGLKLEQIRDNRIRVKLIKWKNGEFHQKVYFCFDVKWRGDIVSFIRGISEIEC